MHNSCKPTRARLYNTGPPLGATSSTNTQTRIQALTSVPASSISLLRCSCFDEPTVRVPLLTGRHMGMMWGPESPALAVAASLSVSTDSAYSFLWPLDFMNLYETGSLLLRLKKRWATRRSTIFGLPSKFVPTEDHGRQGRGREGCERTE